MNYTKVLRYTSLFLAVGVCFFNLPVISIAQSHVKKSSTALVAVDKPTGVETMRAVPLVQKPEVPAAGSVEKRQPPPHVANTAAVVPAPMLIKAPAKEKRTN